MRKEYGIDGVMFEGLSQVDNENNNQSRYSNMSNAYMSESLIYGIERHSIRSGISETRNGT